MKIADYYYQLNIRKKGVYLIPVLILTVLAACSSGPKKQSSEQVENDSTAKQTELTKGSSEMKAVMEKDGLRLSALDEASSFPEASLKLTSPTEKLKAGAQAFQFKVEGYELAVETEDDRAFLLANSAKGQHIHFILNNGPYQAHYENEFNAELSEGNNVILAFLSRSYHESVKEPNAFVFTNIAIGEEIQVFDETAAHLFYSRPKGSYKLEESKRILIDFYLLNADLSKNGMQVELSIDKSIFMLDSWQPYWVEGLIAGEHEFRLRLLDQDGNLIPGPFNDSGVRVVTIE